MVTKFKPYDLGIWLENIDANALSDSESSAIANVNIEDDKQLSWLVSEWIRPRFFLWDEQNQSEMQAVLAQSANWSEKELRSVVDEFQLPSGQKIEDISRFLKALRDEFL